MTRKNLTQSAAFTLLFALLAGVAFGRASAAPAPRAGADPVRPNVVVIQTDDQSLMSLRSTYRDYWDNRKRTMPKTLDLIGAKGIEFTNFYASNPLCSPSRAALLSGQYGHTSNMKRNSGPEGGWEGWKTQPIMNENLAVALDRAGYRTAHIGKFTNGYVGTPSDPVDLTVPPGWDHWLVPSYGDKLYYYGNLLNVDGVAEGPFGDPGYDMQGVGTDPPECTAANLVDPVLGVVCNHSTDMFSRDAVEQIEQSDGTPFYLQVDYNTPHGDHRSPNGAEPLSRHYDSALKTRMPRPPGFNEADISDKPSYVRNLAPMSAGEMDQIEIRWQKDLESLRGVDDGVGAIVEALKRAGKLNSTYIFFVSDNGQFNGEHRMSSAKFLPYEPSTHLPLLVRGPGIKPGSKSGELVANIDLAPTILGLTGARLRGGYDGRSLKPFWKDLSRRTRRPIVLEAFSGPNDVPPIPGFDAGVSATAPPRNYSGLRAGRYKYVEYTSGERELYDLATDPAELENQIGKRVWRSVASRLSAELAYRRICRGASCRTATTRLPDPPDGKHRRTGAG